MAHVIQIIWLGTGIVLSSLPTAILDTTIPGPESSHLPVSKSANKATEDKAIADLILKDQQSESSIVERLTLPNHVDSGAANSPDPANATQLTLHLNSKGLDQLTASWAMDLNATEVTSFVATYKTSKGEHYDSNLLSKLVREYTFTSLDKDEEYTVCVYAMVNSTSVQQVCSVWSESSMKVIVGVLAGVVGLIPCFLALIWVMRKDKKMTAYAVLESNDNEKEKSEGEDIHIPVKDHKDSGLPFLTVGGTQKDFVVSTPQGGSHIREGYENYCFSLERDGEDQSCTQTKYQSKEDSSEQQRANNRQGSSDIHHKQHNQYQQASMGHNGVALNVADLSMKDGRNCTHSIIWENTVHITSECRPDVDNTPTNKIGHCHCQEMDSSSQEILDNPGVGQNNNYGSVEANVPAFTITHF